MDYELRELERQAHQGDRQALYKLLIKRVALDDFSPCELSQEVRFKLIKELLMCEKYEYPSYGKLLQALAELSEEQLDMSPSLYNAEEDQFYSLSGWAIAGLEDGPCPEDSTDVIGEGHPYLILDFCEDCGEIRSRCRLTSGFCETCHIPGHGACGIEVQAGSWENIPNIVPDCPCCQQS